jgi:hypothetical protein
VTQIAIHALDRVQDDAVQSSPTRFGALTRRIGRIVARIRNIPNLGTWIGVLLATAGAVLLVVAWGKTAGLTNVALQVPYVVSAGFTGLGLIATGLTVINISAKQADARERTRQVTELRELLTELRATIQDER